MKSRKYFFTAARSRENFHRLHTQYFALHCNSLRHTPTAFIQDQIALAVFNSFFLRFYLFFFRFFSSVVYQETCVAYERKIWTCCWQNVRQKKKKFRFISFQFLFLLSRNWGRHVTVLLNFCFYSVSACFVFFFFVFLF